MYQFSNEPLGIGQQLDQSVKLTRYTYKSSLPILVLAMIIGVLSVLATGVGAVPAEDGTVDMSGGQAFALIVFGFLQAFLYFLMVARITYEAYGLGDLGDAASFSGRNLHRLVGLYIMLVLVLMIGFILLIIPGLILMISLSVCFYCFILEGTGPIDSLKRSHELIWGNWMRTMVVLSVGGIVVIVLLMALGFIGGFVGALAGAEDFVWMGNLINAALSPLVQPYFVALALVVYRDVKLRKEGEDLSSEIDSL